MWLLHAVDEPPDNIVTTSHGEIVITKRSPPSQAKSSSVLPIGSASTLTLCGQTTQPVEVGPWPKQDPWGGFQPSHGPSGPKPTVTPI